jgi:uncharacterized protein (DUF1697 family)
MARYVALLRGINVGGNNIIKMVDLKACFESLACSDVATYIQSGNVVFEAKSASKAALVKKIEAALSKAFSYESRVVLFSDRELARVVDEAPPGFGKEPKKYRYDVLFVKEPLTAKEAVKQVPLNPAVDQVQAGKHALYYRRSISKATQSRLSKIVTTPVYKHLTIRNWNTTTKLLAMMGA